MRALHAAGFTGGHLRAMRIVSRDASGRVGRLAYESIGSGDLPTIQGTVLLGAFFIIAFNLVVDVLYAFIDPRVRFA